MNEKNDDDDDDENAVCVCLDVNQDGMNHNCCTERLVILRAQTY